MQPRLCQKRLKTSFVRHLTARFGGITCGQTCSRISEYGSIIFISGLAGRKGYPGFALAGAANAGIEAVTRNLAVELALFANTACAGVIDTLMLDRVFGKKIASC